MNRPLIAVTAAVATAAFTPLAGAGSSYDHVVGAAVARSSDARDDLMPRPVGDPDAQAGAAAAALRRQRVVTREATAARQLKRDARAEFASLRARQEGSPMQPIRVHVHPPLATRRLQIGPRALCDGRLATIVGTNGPDVITGTHGRDVIAALGGDDQMYGLGQNDVICGGAGDDVIWSGAGNDTLYGGTGNDFLVGGAGDDTMAGGGQPFDAVAFFDETGPVTASLVTGTATGEGNDTFTNVSQLHGGGFADTFIGNGSDNALFGNNGDDTLYGGDGNDTLNGGNGDDSLYGEAGDDYLDGGDGTDLLDGGPDFDFCVNGETVINCEAP